MEFSDGMGIEIEEADGVRTVHVSGEVWLANAARLQAALLEGLQPGAKAVVETAGITRIDLSGLQLFCSAHRTWRLKGASLELGTVGAPLREAACTAGYHASVSVCPFRQGRNCLWGW